MYFPIEPPEKYILQCSHEGSHDKSCDDKEGSCDHYLGEEVDEKSSVPNREAPLHIVWPHRWYKYSNERRSIFFSLKGA